MRPKKVILCVASNEQELSTLAFQLNIWGYKPLKAVTGIEAVQLFRENAVDLVLAEAVMKETTGNEIIGKLKQITSHIPMILLGDTKKMAGINGRADAFLHKATLSPVELCEKIRIMSARKRGPRPGTTTNPKQLSVLSACLA